MSLASHSLLQQLQTALTTTTITEWAAIATGLLYVILAAKQQPLCWPAGIISSALYIGINYKAALYLDAWLQVYYCGVGLYGWWLWKRRGTANQKALHISKTPMNLWIILLLTGGAASVGLGALSDQFTDSPVPYFDATLTAFSLVATWMTARKLLENWVLWIAADAAYVVLYQQRGLPFTALLFLIFTFTAIAGYLTWRKHYRNSNA